MFRAANTPDKSNKILLRAMKTAALEVIKYYCPGHFTPGSQKLLESMRKHRGQSQAQAEPQSQAQAEGQPQAHDQCASTHKPQPMHRLNGTQRAAGISAQKVIIYDESELPEQLTW
jgi:hypothetical protein